MEESIKILEFSQNKVLLKLKMATEISIRIMDAFVKMRHFINNNIDMLKELDEIKNLTIKNTNDIEKNTKLINELQNSFNKYKDKINYIFYKGQVLI